MLAGHELRQGEGLLVLRQTGRVDKTGVVAFAQYLAAEQAFGKTSRGDRQIEAALHQGPADDLAMSLAENQSQPRRTSCHFLDQASAMGNFEIIGQPDDDRAALVMTGARVNHRQALRSEEHTSELQSLMRISYAVFCLKKKNILDAMHTPASMPIQTLRSFIAVVVVTSAPHTPDLPS